MGVGKIFPGGGAIVDFSRGSQKDFVGVENAVEFILPTRN